MKEFISRGKLKKAAISEGMIAKEFNIGVKDLASAQQSFDLGNYKWATIQAYYGIYHAVRSLVFKSGYREESHFALRVAFKELYIDIGILDSDVYRTLQRGMDLREMADYKETFSENSARILIKDVSLSLDKIRDFLLNDGIELTRGEK